MPLTKYQRFAYRTLGRSLGSTARSNDHLRLSLQKAHIFLRPEVYLGYSYLNMLLTFAVMMTAVLVLSALTILNIITMPTIALVGLFPLPLAAAFGIYLFTYITPDLKAQGRARDIDAKLPYAINYMSTMASAGVTPDKIFESLAQQPIYGEVAKEASLITRDLHHLGQDLITALTAAIDRSPSIRFQDFIQGAITSVSSGGNLKQYFRSKADQYVYDNRQDQKKFLENLGVLAESYVTVVVAGPLFLIVLLSVMLMFGGNPSGMLAGGYLLILVLLPVAHAAFGFTIKYVTPEV